MIRTFNYVVGCAVFLSLTLSHLILTGLAVQDEPEWQTNLEYSDEQMPPARTRYVAVSADTPDFFLQSKLRDGLPTNAEFRFTTFGQKDGRVISIAYLPDANELRIDRNRDRAFSDDERVESVRPRKWRTKLPAEFAAGNNQFDTIDLVVEFEWDADRSELADDPAVRQFLPMWLQRSLDDLENTTPANYFYAASNSVAQLVQPARSVGPAMVDRMLFQCLWLYDGDAVDPGYYVLGKIARAFAQDYPEITQALAEPLFDDVSWIHWDATGCARTECQPLRALIHVDPESASAILDRLCNDSFRDDLTAQLELSATAAAEARQLIVGSHSNQD